VRLVILLLCVVAVASILYVLLSAWLAERARRHGPWRVETVTRPGGELAVIVLREGSEHVRTVRELPAGIDSVELASELRLAREDAQLQADELNRTT
jgi:Kef-type K+ transport system membrane component KefB